MMRARPAVLAIAAGALLACHRDPGPRPIEAAGTVEVVEVDVAPTVAARVTRVWVDEGAAVRAGDTLVALTQATLPADIDARRARVAEAEAQLRDLEQGARPAEIAGGEAERRVAAAEAERTASDVRRLTPLFERGDISAQQMDAARAAAAAAESRRDAAAQSLRLLEQGTRPERIRAARAAVANARAALEAAQRTASDLVLAAPVSGVVLSRNAEPGEVLGPATPAITLGEIGRPWVRIFVDQRALPRIRVGDPATAVLDDYPGHPFAGRVVAIRDQAEFTPRVALTERERADLLFGVKVELRDTTGMLKPGLPVTVRIAGSAAARPAASPDDRAAPVPISARP